jgi:hypothetical protein
MLNIASCVVQAITCWCNNMQEPLLPANLWYFWILIGSFMSFSLLYLDIGQFMCILSGQLWRRGSQVEWLKHVVLSFLLTYSFTHSLHGADSFLRSWPLFIQSRNSCILWFITSCTHVHHQFLSKARSVQSMPPELIPLKSILTLPFHLCLSLPSGLFPSGFPTSPLTHTR